MIKITFLNKNLTAFFVVLFIVSASVVQGQENYEIQIYPSEIIEKGLTQIELHSNFSIKGQPMTDDVRPTDHALRQTLELTHGITPNFEIGFYQFVNYQRDFGYQWVGTHIRPKVNVPEKWNLPVGLSVSGEIGYQRREYSADSWTIEIRPIIDKDFKFVYISFNPAFGKSLQGLDEEQPFNFEPGLKVAFHLSKKIDFGTEYYGSTGRLFNPSKIRDQQHTIYAALDLNLHPDWEFNLGAGWGLTQSTDGMIIKVIFGYKFGKKNKHLNG